ncbi:unnamed protein product, partial [Musa banksii]
MPVSCLQKFRTEIGCSPEFGLMPSATEATFQALDHTQ